MCGVKFCAVPNERAGFFQFFVGQRRVEAGNDDVRLAAVGERDSFLAEAGFEEGGADEIYLLTSVEGIEVFGRNVARRDDFRPFGIEAEPQQLFIVNRRVFRGVVGEIYDLASAFLCFADKFDGGREGAFAEVDGAVHVQHEQLNVL